MAGRRRSRATSHLPKGVSQHGNNWVYRPYLGRVNGKPHWGHRQVLCSITSPDSEVIRAHARVIGESTDHTVSWLLTQYQKSSHIRSVVTAQYRTDCEGYFRGICQFPTRDGRTLGVQPLKHITKPLIRRFLDSYRDGKYPVAANRHIEYFSAAWNYTAERVEGIPPNPCKDVTKNKEVSRKRYVTDLEFEQHKALFSDRSYMPLAMELAYLCRLRANEVYAIRKEHQEKAGLRVFRGKGSMGEITRWTPRLQSVVEACLNWNSDVNSEFLLHDRQGAPYKISNHKSQWERGRVKAVALGRETFTFHDLKAKGVSDQKNPDAGHMSKKMLGVYDRRGRVVEPADGELPLE